MALLFGATLLGAAHHRAAAQHGYCTEHGQLVHRHGNEHDRDAEVGHGSVAGPLLHAASTVLHGAHGCPFLSFLRQPLRVDALPLLPGRDAVRAASVHPALPGAHAAIRLLRLAPKSSPPPTARPS